SPPTPVFPPLHRALSFPCSQSPLTGPVCHASRGGSLLQYGVCVCVCVCVCWVGGGGVFSGREEWWGGGGGRGREGGVEWDSGKGVHLSGLSSRSGAGGRGGVVWC